MEPRCRGRCGATVPAATDRTPIRIGEPDDPLEIPRDPPPTTRERNAVVKRVASWLLRNGFRAGIRLSPVGRAIDAVDAGRWLYDQAHMIDAALNPPRTLDELQSDPGGWKLGYDEHHIVERKAALNDGFRPEDIESPENKVRISRLQHWRVTTWYMSPNKDFGSLSPREYLRGKSWGERRRVGLDALRISGVLKQ